MKRLLFWAFLIFTGTTFGQDISAQRLVYYPFNGNANDESGNGFNATVFGATLANDRFGHPNSSYYFDGIDDYINFANVQELKPQMPMTIAFWVRYDSTSYQDQTVFNTSYEENHCTGVWFNSTSATSKPAVNFGDGSYFYTSESRRTFVTDTVIDTNNWYHMIVELSSATNMRIIVNCKEYGGVYSGTGGDIQYSNTPGCLGRHDRDLSLPPDYFKGYIDEFMMWNRVLTVQEMSILCQQAAPLVLTEVEKHKFKCYPNPVDDKLFVSSENDLRFLKLYNVLGDEVLSEEFRSEIDVSKFPPGFYFLKCGNEHGFDTKKIVIK